MYSILMAISVILNCTLFILDRKLDDQAIYKTVSNDYKHWILFIWANLNVIGMQYV